MFSSSSFQNTGPTFISQIVFLLPTSNMRVHLSSTHRKTHSGLSLCLHCRDTVTAPMVLFCSLLRTDMSSHCLHSKTAAAATVFFLQQNVFAWLRHWTSHILETYKRVGAKAELVPTDLRKIFWKYPSDLLILPCSDFLNLCFSPDSFITLEWETSQVLRP